MATFNKVNDWVENLIENVDAESDQFVIALSDTAPSAETSDPTLDGNGILANVTEIGYTNLSSRNITTTSSGQTGGTYKLVLADITLTSSGGSTGPFRYVYVYDDTVATPTDPLVGYWDKGSSITLSDGDDFTVDFDDTAGAFQIS